MLLEAHSFIDNDRELIDVPTAVMRALDIAGLLVLEAPADEIRHRREHDRRRRPIRSVAEIKAQQRHSRTLAQMYATDLSIPLNFIGPSDVSVAISFIDQVASNKYVN